MSPLGVAFAFVVLALGAVGFLPLFGGPGYEQALTSGLIVPSATAIGVALHLSSQTPREPLDMARRALVLGLLFALAAWSTALLHGLRVGFCDLTGGSLYFALTVGAGTLLAAVWGAVVAETSRRFGRRRLAAVLLAVAAPLGCIAVSVGRFYGSPMVFAYDPFVGHFAGTLYDTVVEPGSTLLTYRGGTLATLLGAIAAASLLERRAMGGLGVVSFRVGASWWRLAFALAALGTSLGVSWHGARLGHWSTSQSIAQSLGGTRAGPRCEVIFPETLRPEESALLVKDCEEQLTEVESKLGVRGPERIRAWFFRDATEKKRLMGAGDTYIAKPWRHEVYLQLGAYPHPVLGHELAHVVAGTFGHGPFRVAGSLGGWLPNPGLIEGIAVAASPHDDDLTELQWARAMLDLGKLPSLRQVFSLGFLGTAASTSYTVAGAFVQWAMERFGQATVRGWYGGGDIETLTGLSWTGPAGLEEAFKAHLATLEVPSEALGVARARFDRPGVFRRACPHVVDALEADASRCAEAHRVGCARGLWDKVLAKDPLHYGVQLQAAFFELREGDEALGRSRLEALLDNPKVPSPVRDRAEETLADADFLRGHLEEARQRYETMALRVLGEDIGRTLEVKALACGSSSRARAIGAMLLGEARRAPDGWLGAFELGRWSAEGDALSDYVTGRNLVQRGWYVRAVPYLDRALGLPSVTRRIRRELLRQRAIAACALSDREGVERVALELRSERSPFARGGRVLWLEGLLGRCASFPTQ
jgi:hypothetical protein